MFGLLIVYCSKEFLNPSYHGLQERSIFSDTSGRGGLEGLTFLYGPTGGWDLWWGGIMGDMVVRHKFIVSIQDPCQMTSCLLDFEVDRFG